MGHRADERQQDAPSPAREIRGATVASPSPTTVPSDEQLSARTVAPSAASTFGMAPLPAPRSPASNTAMLLRSPPTPYRGAASPNSDILSLHSPGTVASRLGLNPTAPEWPGGARALLNRGQDIQPDHHDPHTDPDRRGEPGLPAATLEQAARRRADGINHLAMAWRRLTATHVEADENAAARLRQAFVQEYDEEYTDAESRAIQDEPDDPPEEQPEEPEDDDIYGRVRTMTLADG